MKFLTILLSGLSLAIPLRSGLGKQWSFNLHLKLIEEVTKTDNLSDCRVCVHMPEHLGKGMHLIGVPIPTDIKWATLWVSTSFNISQEVDQEWDVEESPYPRTCINRCNPQKD